MKLRLPQYRENSISVPNHLHNHHLGHLLGRSKFLPSFGLRLRLRFRLHLRAPYPSTIASVAASVETVAMGLRIIAGRRSGLFLRRVRHPSPTEPLLDHQMGFYDVLNKKWTDPNTNNLFVASKVTAGLVFGAVGATVGNPADMAMVWIEADGRPA
ncbi:mitochondrial uncoupling protein 4-like [Henckelia pumila]|uniref:mitochondrial uncoupling protein 4-like n=1 Tax=Henckelia pumila TaxID=405737 RepID=UPI003C6E2AAF